MIRREFLKLASMFPFARRLFGKVVESGRPLELHAGQVWRGSSLKPGYDPELDFYYILLSRTFWNTKHSTWKVSAHMTVASFEWCQEDSHNRKLVCGGTTIEVNEQAIRELRYIGHITDLAEYKI